MQDMGDKGANMIRKLLMVAVAAAVPMGAVATGLVGTGQAGAAPIVAPPISCAVSSTVTFAPPGISENGVVVVGKGTSSVSVSTVSYTGCTGGPLGSGSGSSSVGPIVSKNSKCAGPNSPVAGCAKHDTYFDTAAGFAGQGPSSIQKSLKKITLVVEGVSFSGKTHTSSLIVPGGACGSEGGFALGGSVKAKPYSYSTFSFNACLGNDTGMNTTNNTVADITASLTNPAIVVATSTIDMVQSSLHIS
jgi:hypothetical protein